MIETYSSYIDTYMVLPKRENRPVPGEHHFVSAYLIPRIFSIRGKVPEYINPDGTKSIVGDVVYYDAGKHQHGLEVKLETIRLTSGEFNNWIVSNESSDWPDSFIGIARKGIVVCSWREFRRAYIKLIQAKKGNEKWVPMALEPKKYGPIRQVDLLIPHLGEETVYLYESQSAMALAAEEKFMEALRHAVGS